MNTLDTVGPYSELLRLPQEPQIIYGRLVQAAARVTAFYETDPGALPNPTDLAEKLQGLSRAVVLLAEFGVTKEVFKVDNSTSEPLLVARYGQSSYAHNGMLVSVRVGNGNKIGPTIAKTIITKTGSYITQKQVRLPTDYQIDELLTAGNSETWHDTESAAIAPAQDRPVYPFSSERCRTGDEQIYARRLHGVLAPFIAIVNPVVPGRVSTSTT